MRRSPAARAGVRPGAIAASGTVSPHCTSSAAGSSAASRCHRRDEALDFGSAVGQVFGANDQQLQADACCGRGGDIFGAARVIAGEMDRGPAAAACSDHAVATSLRTLCCSAAIRIGAASSLEQRLQARVEQVDAGKVVQYSLVDAQWRSGQPPSRFDVDQPPAAQRPHRRDGAPVRSIERCKCKAEGRGAAPLATSVGAGSGQLANPSPRRHTGAATRARRTTDRRLRRFDRLRMAPASPPPRRGVAYPLRQRPSHRRASRASTRTPRPASCWFASVQSCE